MAATVVQTPFATACGGGDPSEDQLQFDAGYRRALDAATRSLRLDELEVLLAYWRRVA